MKLEEAVIMGKFMGLDSVAECILNTELHYWSLLPPSDVGVERSEFNLEVKKWEEGKLDLDWDYINAKVEEQKEEYNDWLDRQNFDVEIDDLEFFR